MATPGYVTDLSGQFQKYQQDPKLNPFSGINPSGANTIATDKIIQGLPSLAVGPALQTLGKSQYGPFGSYIMSTVAPNLNNIFEALTPVGAADDPTARRQFYQEYTAGLYNPSSPYNINLQEAGNILQDALSGSSDTILSNTLRTGDTQAQVGAIQDYIKGFGATTMSATKVNMMNTQLYQMLSDYTARGLNGSLDPDSTSFIQYLVSRSADFLDRFFGQRGWSALSSTDFTDPQASSTAVPTQNVPPPIVPANGANR